ncbi:prepilin-type N-terminal cleavage/methylation domain-containing protein [Bacteriovoracaceae bacterium]|nr:prepilin-type N-terminal cleavage/methylation domain-containing protein [Bacteriovoracaceae bacterium]
MDKKLDQSGFSLLEVLIALTIFAVFVTAFLTAQGYNISDSITIKEELTLRNLAELKINEIILNPPEFTEALNNKIEKKNFELEGLKNYSYEIVYKKIVMPDFSQLTNSDEAINEEVQEQDKNGNIQKMVMEKLKENIEKIIWQVQVTIKNSDNGDNFAFTVSTWISDPKAKIELNLGI